MANKPTNPDGAREDLVNRYPPDAASTAEALDALDRVVDTAIDLGVGYGAICHRVVRVLAVGSPEILGDICDMLNPPGGSVAALASADGPAPATPAEGNPPPSAGVSSRRLR